MKEHIRPLVVTLGILSCVAILGFSFASDGEAKEEVPPVILEMRADILKAQQYVREHERLVIDSKKKAGVYRSAICQTQKKYCTREYLDPLNTGIDLSSFQVPVAAGQ